MRGKGIFRFQKRGQIGITPAYAGKRLTKSERKSTVWDHPRICGEKLACLEQCGILLGSPPHMRGKASRTYFEAVLSGITPAYAGKRRTWKENSVGNWDHPRICGEKPTIHLRRLVLRGSPPHMRGKGQAAKVWYAGAGITPAYAGKSLRRVR